MVSAAAGVGEAVGGASVGCDGSSSGVGGAAGDGEAAAIGAVEWGWGCMSALILSRNEEVRNKAS